MAVSLTSVKFQVASLNGNYSSTAIALTPLGYWKLGERDGNTTAADSSGNSRDGSYIGAPTLGVSALWDASGSTAVSFDGTNDTVTMGDVAAFRFTGAFTLTCWVKYSVNGAGTSGSGIVTKCEAASIGAAGYGLQVVSGAKTLQFFALTAAEAVVFNVTTSTGYGDGLWHHVACTWDGTTTANKVIIYVDGTSVATGTAAAGTIGTGAYAFRLGARGATAADFFTGSIDNVAVFGSALSAASVSSLSQYGSDWVNTYNADWCNSETTKLTRGFGDTNIGTRTASIGTAEFSLQNGTNSVGGVRGYYSLDTTTFNGVTVLGKRIRFLATYAGTDYALWTGRIRSVLPVPGVNGEQIVHVTGHDAIGDLSEFAIREITPQISQTETALLKTVIDAVPSKARPELSVDSSLETYPYALDNMSGENGLGLKMVQDLVVSAWGLCWTNVYNGLQYRNRTTEGNVSTSVNLLDADIVDVSVLGSEERAFTRVRTTVHPRTVDAAATTQLCSGAGQFVPHNASVTIWLDYHDPNQKHVLIGATAIVTPLTTPAHYLANANADGSGADLTANISIVTTAFATAAKFVITNSGGTDAYMTLLQLLGKGIYDDGPVTHENTAAVDSVFYDNILDVDMPYKANGIINSAGSHIANALATNYSTAFGNGSLSEVVINPQKSSTMMTNALTKDVGDIVTVTETMSITNGTPNGDGMIVGVSHELTPSTAGPILMTRWSFTKPSRGAY